MRGMCALGAGVVGLLAAAGSAQATFVNIMSNSGGSTDGLGRFTGTITYTADTLSTGTLTILLSNTNTPAEGGYITGLVFNVPGTGTSQLTSAPAAGFGNLGPTESASPYGTYEAGAGLGGSWLGGGSPTGGIGAGQSGTFVFSISSPDAATLTASSFLATGTSPAPLIRFRGFANGGSDKVPSSLLPAPGTGALLAGAGVLAARRRRR